MRQLKMLASGHTEVRNPGKRSTVIPFVKNEVLTFPDDREAAAVRLVELGLAEDVTPPVAPIEPLPGH